MAFMGVLLGLFARVGFEQDLFLSSGFGASGELDAEMGLPLLLKTVLPVGLTGLMMSAYFSAIMSTADSCLMAASGNIVTDLLYPNRKISARHSLRISQIATLIIGFLAIVLASVMPSVLELMLLSYAFMVSGLFIPTIGAIYWKYQNATAAIAAMLTGGSTTILLELSSLSLPMGLDSNIGGILVSLIVFIGINLVWKNRS
jgi:SSS family solute:Na+ symporter